MADAGQLYVPDLLGGNFEIVFLIFTELEGIVTQNQRAGESHARAGTVIDRHFDWRGQIERLRVALSHPGGKLLHQLLIRKLAELLNDVLVVKPDQHVLPGPGPLPAPDGIVSAARRPKNSPF